MITAVDTNVLLDLLIPGADQGEASEQALTRAFQAGAVVISEAVYAELAAQFQNREALDLFLNDTGIRLDPSGPESLYLTGRAWRDYARRRPAGFVCASCGAEQSVECQACGNALRTRQHVIADFLIGSHAMVHADRLLSRDRGYYRTYFPELRLA